ncbi:hypothetical protein [Ancylobacter sp. FA202]|uniref:hypothetical protein n=1 Tax=Ancylobacter sp. FA202 TaxID=1111106 RepID=UPI0012DC3236|nr:hypothetical protein [Ancylobacter sp. FA202]
MFGWLKKRRLNEQKKLIFQNGMASEIMARGYFAQRQDSNVVDILDKIQAETSRISSLVDANSLVSTEETARLLEMNKVLRRIYDSTAMRHVSGFDDAYRPLLGWDELYKRGW